jgi:hypothetical protein
MVPIAPNRPCYRGILRGIADDYGVTTLDTAFLSAGDPSLWLPGEVTSRPRGPAARPPSWPPMLVAIGSPGLRSPRAASRDL